MYLSSIPKTAVLLYIHNYNRCINYNVYLYAYTINNIQLATLWKNVCIAQDILENMNTTQDALSGTGYNRSVHLL